MGFTGVKVGVVDERSEIGGTYQGMPQNSIGIRTDLLDAVPKAQGMMLLIRSLSPEVLVTDEIGGVEDIKALREAMKCGVQVIATAHASSRSELKRRPAISPLLKMGYFQRLVVLSRREGAGTIEGVFNGQGNCLQGREGVECSSFWEI